MHIFKHKSKIVKLGLLTNFRDREIWGTTDEHLLNLLCILAFPVEFCWLRCLVGDGPVRSDDDDDDVMMMILSLLSVLLMLS